MTERRQNQRDTRRDSGYRSAEHSIVAATDERADDTGAVFRRLAHYWKPYRSIIYVLLFWILLGATAQGVGPYLVGRAIDDYITVRDANGLMRMMFLLLGVYFLQYLAFRGQVLKLGVISAHTLYDVRTDLFKAIQRLNMNYFDKNAAGDLMSRLVNDTETVGQFMGEGLSRSLGSFFSLIGILITMFVLDWRLTLATAAVLPAMVIALQLLARFARRAYRQTRETIGDVSANLEEEISGVRVAQAFSRTEFNSERFTERNNANRNANIRAEAATATIMPTLEMLSASSIAIVLGYGGWRVLNDQITIGLISSFLLYVNNFFRPVQVLATFYGTAQAAFAGAERIFALVDEPVTIEDPANPKQLPVLDGAVKFENVSFAYEPDKPILKDVSIDIQPGQTVAIVGPTGAGKTTIINLLGRFYEVDKGRVLVDGIDIRDVRRADLRQQMGIVLQDNFLFSGSIADNIRYGYLDATDEEVKAAAEAVNAHVFIEKLEDGYATALGERGGNLSQGQRQLISFARAILSNPRILILDEATSSVDTRTEALIQKALEKLLSERTAFVIAHRLSTIRNADLLLVIEDGRIAEQGSHAELLEKDGLYAELYNRQFYKPEE